MRAPVRKSTPADAGAGAGENNGVRNFEYCPHCGEPTCSFSVALGSFDRVPFISPPGRLARPCILMFDDDNWLGEDADGPRAHLPCSERPLSSGLACSHDSPTRQVVAGTDRVGRTLRG